MKKYVFTILMAFVFSLGTLATGTALAQKDSMAGPSKEQREQMAKAHEKMSECLRSDVSIQDCHQQMREQHQGMPDDGDCPMMGKGMMGNRKKGDSKKDK